MAKEAQVVQRPSKPSLEEIKAIEKTKQEFRQNKVFTATKQGSRASSINRARKLDKKYNRVLD